jgi:predicted amidohydrolase
VEADVWDTILRARALENTIYLAGVNRVGTEGEIKLFGGSCIIDPRGRYLAQAKINEEDLLIKTINLDDLSSYRCELPYLRDRQPDLYSNIANRIMTAEASQKDYYPFPVKPQHSEEAVVQVYKVSNE